MSPAKCAATSKKFFPKRKHGPAAGKPFPQRTQKASQISAGLSNPTDWPAGIRRPFRSNGLARQGTPHRHPPAFPTQRTRPAGHPPQASAGHSAPTDSPGRAHPIGIRRPFRPNGLARQGTPHRYPPAFPTQQTRPAGHAPQASAGHSAPTDSPGRAPPQASAGLSAPTDSPGRASVADFRRPQPAEPTKIRFFRGHAPRKKHLSALQCAAP